MSEDIKVWAEGDSYDAMLGSAFAQVKNYLDESIPVYREEQLVHQVGSDNEHWYLSWSECTPSAGGTKICGEFLFTRAAG